MGRTVIVIALILLSIGARTAAAKPRVAVLGIEVTGTIDQTSTGVAHDLTEGLRNKAKAGNGPFQLAPNADRELIDEKVLKNCDSEGPLCMSDIGKDIGTDMLIYGKLEKTGDGYTAKLHLLDVRKKSHEKQIVVQIPGGQSGDAVRTVAKKAYSDLAGRGGGGGSTLVVKANTDTGTVFVDDEQKESLVEGSATLTLPEGRYRIAVESPGRRRKEKTVMITTGEAASENFDLVAIAVGGGGKKSNIWKPVFGISLAATAVLGGISLYSFLDWRGKVSDIKATYKDGRDAAVGDGDCNGSGISSSVNDSGGTLGAVCTARWRNITTGIAAGAVGLFSVGAAYMAFFRNDKESTPGTSSRRVRPHSLLAGRPVLTPLLTPTTQGALLQFSW